MEIAVLQTQSSDIRHWYYTMFRENFFNLTNIARYNTLSYSRRLSYFQMYRIFTELWATTEFHHHQMNFSENTIKKVVTKETPHELFNWNFDIGIFVEMYVCVTSLRTVCSQDIILYPFQASFSCHQNFKS